MRRAAWLVALCVGLGASAQAVDTATAADAVHAALAGEPLDALGLPALENAASADAWRDAVWAAYRETVTLPEPTRAGVGRVGDREVPLAWYEVELGDGAYTMPYVVVDRRDPGTPEGGHAWFYCTHGGGQRASVDGPHAWNVNTREWETQVQLAAALYGPAGWYVVPRMADDRRGRWWHAHQIEAFEVILRESLAQRGVDPDKVYMMGISEGGYGTSILGPWMPDALAGANAMAAGVSPSNPPRNLRNLPFRTDVGERDTMFDRVAFARAYHEALDALHEADPEGYPHALNVQAGRGHGIDYRPGVEWIAGFEREARPARVVWQRQPMDGLRRERMYWVGLDDATPEAGVPVLDARVERERQTVTIDATRLPGQAGAGNPTHTAPAEGEPVPLTGATLTVYLDDALLDLDRPVRVIVNGESVFTGRVERDAETVIRTLVDRGDPGLAFVGAVVVDLP